MTSYAVSGNVREQLGAEGATEISAAQADAINVVAANIDAILLVANSLAVPGFSNLSSVVNACISAQNSAAGSANQAAASAQAAAASAAGVGASAAAAAASATAAAQGAADSQASSDGAERLADAAADSANAAAANALLAQRYVNDPAGTEVEAGKFSLLTYMAQIQALLASAPVLAGRVIDDTGAGAADTINFAASDFFHTVEVTRSAGHDVTLKGVNGLYTGPPPAGLARSYAWIHVLHRGAGALTIEGPAAGSVTNRPKFLRRGVVDRNTSTPGTATAVTGTVPAIAVPAGGGRYAVIIAHATYWTQTPAAEPAHAVTVTCANITGLTQMQTVGEGTNTGASPILTRIFGGPLATDLALTDLALSYSFGGYLARGHLEVYVFQDVSGVEASAAKAAAGTPASIAQAFACSVANSVVLASAAFRKASATTLTVAMADSPATSDADDTSWASTTGLTTNHDLGVISQQNAGLLAATYTETATPTNVMGAATIAGLVLKPRTVAGGGGLITDGASPFTVANGGECMVLCASDGTTWYVDQ